MSTIKEPAEKKRLRLERERCNRYGENSKASRKNIPRRKQQRHMDERRRATELLRYLTGQVQEDEATDIELLVKNSIVDGRRRGFKKTLDTPLKVVLATRKAKRRST